MSFRFSLRPVACVILMLTAAAGAALAYRAGPWMPLLVLKGHEHGSVLVASFSHGANRIVTGGEDQAARVWDAASGKPMFVLAGHSAYVNDARFAADGQRIITSGGDMMTRLWDADNGRELAAWRGEALEGISPSGDRFATSCADSQALVRDAVTGQRLSVLRGHEGSVIDAEFSPDGGRIATTSHDGTVRVWSVEDGACLCIMRGHKGKTWSAAFSMCGRQVVTTGSDDNTARIWDAGTGECLAVLTGHTSDVIDAAISPDGGSVATVSLDRSIRIWDISGQRNSLVLYDDSPFCVLYLPSGCPMVTVGPSGTQLRDPTTGAILFRIPDRAPRLHRCSFSDDGSMFAAAKLATPEAVVWKKKRPEHWWGVFWLWEFWIAVFFAVVFLRSLWRDRKYFKALDAKIAAKRAEASS